MKSLQELEAIRNKTLETINLRKESEGTRIVVGMATCGIAAGARPVLSALVAEVAKEKLEQVMVSQTGCIGICQYEPVVEIFSPSGEKTTYVKMTPERAIKVVHEHLIQGRPVTEFTIGATKA